MATPTLTPNSKKEQDDRYAPSDLIDEVKQKEEAGGDGFAQIVDGYSEDANPSQEDENIAATGFHYSQTGASQGQSNLVKLKGIFKKVGPAGGLGVLLFGGAGLGLFFLSPGLLLVQMKEVFSNYNSSASRASIPRYNKMLQYTIGNSKVDKACEKPSSVKCKLGTMGPNQKAAYEAAGFTIDGDDKDGRTRIRSVTFPDGHKVSDGNAFIKYSKNNVAAASAASRAHNPAVKVYNGSRFSKVLAKFGQNKSKVALTGDSEEDKKKDFNTKVGGDSDRDKLQADYESKHKATLDKLKPGITSIGDLTKRLGGPVTVACLSYNFARAGLATAKVANAARYATFAIMFLKVADQIKNKGDVDPGTVAALGAILTSYKTSGPDKGLTATDSQGYKIALYGGESKLSSFTQKILLGGNSNLTKLDNTIKWMQDQASIFGTSGKKNIRTMCKGAADPLVAGPILAAICAAETAGSTAAGTVVPGAGNIAGFVAGVTSCVALELLVAVAVGEVANVIIKLMMPHIIDALVDAPIGSDVFGAEAGNAIAIGASVMLGTSALSRGLAPGNKKQVTNFLAATSEAQAQSDAIAKYDAQNEPFNVYNQYSFLGSVVRNSGVVNQQATSISGSLTNLGTILRSSFGIIPKAYATPSMPITISEDDLSHCPDAELVEIGVDCDLIGQPQYVMSTDELDMDIGDNLDFMEAGGFINEEGSPNDGKYKKWTTYCTEQRSDLMGSSSLSIEDSDYDWSTGRNCIDPSGDGAATEEELSNFRVYYNTVAEKEDGDYKPAAGSDSSNGGAATIKMASFNILGSNHDGESKEQGVIANYKTRMKRTVEVIQRESFDVIGFQEFVTDQRKEFNRLTGGTYKLSSNEGLADGGNGIGWNASKYDLLSQGTMPDLQYTTANSKLKAPWVQLKDKVTGYTFYFANTHDPANVHSNGNPGDGSAGDAARRTQNAKAHVGFMESKVAEGTTVFMTGDFNSSFSRHSTDVNVSDGNISSTLPYCVMTSSDVIQNAFDIYKKRDKKCPNQEIRWEEEDPGKGCKTRIDHLYIASTDQSVRVDEFGCNRKGGSASTLANGNGSDHDTVKFTVSVGSEDASNLSVATYNITRIGRNGGTLDKTSKAAKIVKNKGASIIGVQEIDGGAQYQTFLSGLGKNFAGKVNTSEGGGRAIFWDTNLFQEGKSGFYEIQKDGQQKQMVWMELKANGKSIYVFNMHAEVGSSSGDADTRRANARDTLQAIDSVVGSSGAPVILTGDMNSNYTNKPDVYNVLKDTLDLTYDKTTKHTNANCDTIRAGASQECRDSAPASHADQIYISRDNGIVVNSWENVKNGTGEVSDHNPVVANISIPGLAASSSAGGVAWVLGEELWNSKKADFIGGHYTGGGFLGGGSHSNDIGFSEINGKPVYAIFGGKVTKQPLGRSSRKCTGTPNPDHNGGIMIESKVEGGTVVTAYAHGDNVKFSNGASVNSGDQIMTVGNVGNSCGAHLHLDMTYNGKNICTQDLFVMMAKGGGVDFNKLVSLAVGRPGCENATSKQ